MSNLKSIGNETSGLVNLIEYGSVISDREEGQLIYDEIIRQLNKHKSVEIYFDNIITMATYCAKQIFGALYINLGPESFFSRIILKNATDDLKFIVRTGIQSAIDDKQATA